MKMVVLTSNMGNKETEGTFRIMTGSKYCKSYHAEIYQKESLETGMETENVGSRTNTAAHINPCTNSINKKFNKLVIKWRASNFQEPDT